MAQDLRMKRIFKSLSNLKPSLPKYKSTWDPKIVLDHFTKHEVISKLSLQQVSIKLITLLALISGHRMRTFAIIKIENIEIKNKNIEIKIPDRIKTTGANRKQPTQILPFYNKNKKICPATAQGILINYTKIDF